MSPTVTRARASALLFSGAALNSIRVPGWAQTNATIRIATIPAEAAAEVYYANDMAFFAKGGLATDIQPMQSAPAITAAVASGAVNIGFGAVDVLASVHSKDIPVVIVAAATEIVSPNRTVALVLPANSLVQQAKDLNGKIIATPALHGFLETAARAWMDQNGGDSSTVKFVEMPLSTMPTALVANRVDAVQLTEPFVTVAKKIGRILVYGLDAIAKHFVVSVWFASPQWAKDHPDLVMRFAAVMYDTGIWANKNPAASGEILAKYTKIEPGVIATMRRAVYAERLTPSLMQPLIDVSGKYNGFKTFPAQELIYAPSR